MGAGLLPSTFESRGIALPLTTPFFAYARLRQASTGPALTLPSVEKPGCCYLVPLAELAKAVSLTVFDRALLEELEMLSQPGPEEVREFVITTELTGLRGAKPMRQRRAEQTGEDVDPITGTTAASLRRLITAMTGLADDLRRWLIHEPIDSAELAQRTSMALRNTAKLAAPLLEGLEQANEETGPRQEELINLLDGWPRIINRWQRALSGDPYLQRETLTEFFPYLPLLPASHAGGDKEFWEVLAKIQLRWLRRSPLLEELAPETKTILARNIKPQD